MIEYSFILHIKVKLYILMIYHAVLATINFSVNHTVSSNNIRILDRAALSG